jgi:putative protease
MQMTVNVSFRANKKIVSFGYKSERKFDEAINKPVTEEMIINQMSKTGDTPFYINSIRVNDFPDNLFMPLAKINNIRREVLDIASQKLLKSFIPDESKQENIRKTIKKLAKDSKNKTYDTEVAGYVGLNVYVDNLELLTIANRNPINRIYFDASYIYDNKDEYFENIEELMIKAANIASDKEVVWVLSAFTSDEDLNKIKEIHDRLTDNNIHISIMGDSPSLTRIFPDTNVYASHNLNIWNNYSVAMLDKNNFKAATISSELSKEEIEDLVKKSQEYDTKLELIVQGNQEIMVSKDDFSNLKGGFDLDIDSGEYVVLEDKDNNKKYKIYFDYNKQSHFLNNDMLCLIDEIDEIKQMGIENITLDCRFTTPKYINKIINIYIQRLRDENPTRLYSDSIKEISYSKLNKGNYINKRVLEDLKSQKKRKKKRQ